MFWFSLQLLSETFIILRRTERDIITNVHQTSKQSASYSWQIYMKLKPERQISEKHLNIKFNENLSSGSRVFPCERTERQTDRHEEANSLFFRNFASAPTSREFKYFNILKLHRLFIEGDGALCIEWNIMYTDKPGKIRVATENAFGVPLHEFRIFLRKFSVSQQPLGIFIYGGSVYKAKIRQINAHRF